MSNEIVIEAWNTVLFEKFSRFKYLFIEGYASISEEVLKRNKYTEGASVLDVGCGFGDCTLQIAKSLNGNGSAIGVDCASNFIEECKREASEKAVDNASFLIADVEVDDLGGPYDEAFARFGTMFFNLHGLSSLLRQTTWVNFPPGFNEWRMFFMANPGRLKNMVPKRAKASS